jgi:hypothetical protein
MLGIMSLIPSFPIVIVINIITPLLDVSPSDIVHRETLRARPVLGH